MADVQPANCIREPIPLQHPSAANHTAKPQPHTPPNPFHSTSVQQPPTPPSHVAAAPPRLLNLSAYEHEFKRLLPPPTYDYYSGGSHDEYTLRYNSRSFDPFIIRPRTLVNVSDIDCTTSLHQPQLTLALPLLLAPVALQCMAHDEGESGSARAAAATGIAMCVSTTATQSIEQVATASPAATTQLLFQLYVYNDHSLTTQLVRRAEAAGYRGLVVTVDTAYVGYKERDIRNDFAMPLRFEVANFPPGPLRYMRKRPIGVGAAAVTAKEKAVMGRSSAFSWYDLRALVQTTTLPVWVKGVLTPEDAVAACEAGCSGVIVSNHGGRQLDTAPAPVDVITHISDAVCDWCNRAPGSGSSDRRRVSVLMDGGVRRGSDIFKALALGADAVLIGRPLLWGLAYGGSVGVQQVVECLRDELRLCMSLAGCRTIADINRRHLQWRSDIRAML